MKSLLHKTKDPQGLCLEVYKRVLDERVFYFYLYQCSHTFCSRLISFCLVWRATKACSCSICSCCLSSTASCICWEETDKEARRRTRCAYAKGCYLKMTFPKRITQPQSVCTDHDRYNTARPQKSERLLVYCCCCPWHWKEDVFCSGLAASLSGGLWGN